LWNSRIEYPDGKGVGIAASIVLCVVSILWIIAAREGQPWSRLTWGKTIALFRSKGAEDSTPKPTSGSSTGLPQAVQPQPARKQAARPQIEIGIVLGADQGIGKDAMADCSKRPYHCLSEAEIKTDNHVRFAAGTKGWARIIFRLKNVGDAKLIHDMSHIWSPDPISIEFVPKPDPSRLPRNVLDIVGGYDIYPFSLSQAQVATPVDIDLLP
jgi:hypothetical protein